MNNPLKMKSWSPYVVGAGIGVLSWFAFATANHPIFSTCGVAAISVSAAVFVVLLFVAGTAMTFALYGKEARNLV
jgi:hypothetical protein